MKAVIYGAGNIGRGFIGLLLSQSGYEVVFLDINKEVIDRLNRDRRYTVCAVNDDKIEETSVTNVRGVDSSVTEDAVNEIFEADIMATSVGVNVLRHIAKPIALGVEKRISAKKQPLNILLCENLIGADKYLKDEMFKYLSAAAREMFAENVGLVEASIGRMVPVLPKNENDPLKVYTEHYCTLQLDKDGFTGEIPEIKNTVIYSPFKYYIQRKLFIHNMCHALSAYLGAAKGKTYINEAISDIEIKHLVIMAGISSAAAIAKDNGAEEKPLLDFLFKLIYRFNNGALKDTAARVGRDPVRKLNKNDRIIGCYDLCKKQGIDTIYLCASIAAALNFNGADDEASALIQKKIEGQGVIDTLKEISGYDGFDKSDLESIVKFYNLIKEKDFSSVIACCEKAAALKIFDF